MAIFFKIYIKLHHSLLQYSTMVSSYTQNQTRTACHYFSSSRILSLYFFNQRSISDKLFLPLQIFSLYCVLCSFTMTCIYFHESSLGLHFSNLRNHIFNWGKHLSHYQCVRLMLVSLFHSVFFFRKCNYT